MSNYNDVVNSINKYNKDACEELYRECDELSRQFSATENDCIQNIRKYANDNILEINTATSRLSAQIKRTIDEKMSGRTQKYTNLMKEYKIF